ncbi:FtsK/SpoIIIE domain-containing protein [Promicromonospora xylanilytica]
MRELEAHLRALAGAARQLGFDGQHVMDSEVAQARRALNDVERADDASVGPETAAAGEAYTAMAPGLRLAADRLAPGSAGSDPSDEVWAAGGSPAGAHWPGSVRVGVLDATDVPVVLPLLGTAGWAVMPAVDDETWQPEDREAALQVVQQAVLRLATASEPFGVRVETFDPQVTGTVGVLGGVTRRFPQVVAPAVHDLSGLRPMLSSLVETSSARATRMAQAGLTRFAELQARSRRADPHRVVVVLDYPRGIDERSNQDLLRLATSGASRGIALLVTFDYSADAAPGVDPDLLLDHLDAVVTTGDLLVADQLPGVPVLRDDPIRQVTAVCDAVVARTEAAELPTIPFTETLPPRDRWWTPVGDGLEAVLGFADADPVVVRLRSANPPLPHLLVAGAVGQGKSNLLLTVIHGLAARYSPDDLEMYLLDFKHGVEFARLGPATGRDVFLPHAKVLGIHADRTFGVAVLRHLTEELARRSEVFKAYDAVDISDLPAGPNRPPRLLVVLDEFQVLVDGDDDLATEAVTLLERLARLGRAYGVHLILATQTLDGTARLTAKRDAILGQIPLRLALKTTAADSQVILGSGNLAAAQLEFRGQVIVNANYGAHDDNLRAQVAYADHEILAALRSDLWQRAGGSVAVPPRVFHLAQPAHLPTALARQLPVAGPDGVAAWAGLPVAVTETPAAIPVRPEPGAGVLVLGDGPAEGVGVLTGLVLSTILSAPPQARPKVVLLAPTAAGRASDAVADEGTRALVEVLWAAGADVEHLKTPEAITGRIMELRTQIASDAVDGPTLLVTIGLHALSGLKEAPPGLFETPAAALDDVVRRGPSAGIVTFGWWNRLHAVTDVLGYDHANLTGYVFLRHPVDGVRSALGMPLLTWASEPARALVWDGIGPEPVQVVPFAPLTADDVEHVARHIRSEAPEGGVR